MEWIVFALLAAVFATAVRILIKTSKHSGEEVLVFSRYAYGLLPAFIFLLFLGLPENIGQGFYYSVILLALFDIAGISFLTLSIKKSDFSKSVPFISLTPVFVILTGFLILGELPSLIGIAGILIIVFGAYWISYEDHHSLIDSFKSIYKEPGPKYMIVAAFFFSLTGVFAKKTVLTSSPLFAVTFTLLLPTLIIALFYTVSSKRKVKEILPNKKDFTKLFFIGVLDFAILYSIFIGLETGLVSYVISIKRFSIILNVAIGAMFFKEKGALRHLLGAVVMVAGAILIGLS